MANESLFVARTARLFRYAAYAATGVIILTLFWTSRPRLVLVLAVLYCVAAPCLIDLAKRVSGSWNMACQGVENFASPAMAGLIAMPPMATLLVLVAVLTGNVAQGGWRFLKGCLPLMAMGWCAGLWLFIETQPQQRLQTLSDLWLLWPTSNFLAEGLAAVVLMLFVTGISFLGYRQTMRMYETREQLRQKSEQLSRLNERIAHYLPPQVTHRLFCETEPSLPLQRKWISVCFVDIAHFTSMTARLAPEEIAIVLNDFLRAMTRLAARADAMVDKFIGDGVMIIFGDPSSEGRRQDAGRALNLLLELPSYQSELSRCWQHQGIEQNLSVRVGLASGFCTVGDFGNAERLDYTVIGKAVNLASRLQTLAGTDEVLIDQASYNLLQEKKLFAAMGSLDVRGMPSPVEVYRMKLTRHEPTSAAVFIELADELVDVQAGSDKVRAPLP